MLENSFLSKIATFFILYHSSYLHPIADISCVVIDLKYNKEQGVKICEMQPGSFSKFSGADILEGMNQVPDRYLDFIQKYYPTGYFTHPLNKQMKQVFIKRGWRSIHSPDQLLLKIGSKPNPDPDNLFEYQTCLFSLSTEAIFRKEPKRFPQILFLDRAILPYSQNKYTMNSFFDRFEKTRKLRPVWQVYPKGDSERLIEQISSDIPGEIVVIKPIQSTMGRGVIITEKKELKRILNYVFYAPKEVLLSDSERSYSQYAIDSSDHFIAEEFIPSDPLFLGGHPYDCTMRVVAILSYHQKNPSLTYLAHYWYSPSKPIDPAYTLIESHKAKGTHFALVDPEIFDEVKAELTPALLEAYQGMLHDE